MKKADIKPGVVYAYQRSANYSPEPIVFLATGLYTSRGRYNKDKPWASRALAGDKIGRNYLDRETGYPIARRDWQAQGVSDEEIVRQMLALAPADWEGAADGTVGAVRLDILMRLGQITGLYDEVVAERTAREKAARELAAEVQQEADTSRTRAIDTLTALRAHGIEPSRIPSYGGVESISLPLAEAEKLIRLLRQED